MHNSKAIPDDIVAKWAEHLDKKTLGMSEICERWNVSHDTVRKRVKKYKEKHQCQ